MIQCPKCKKHDHPNKFNKIDWSEYECNKCGLIFKTYYGERR